jgi:hypothetical protein
MTAKIPQEIQSTLEALQKHRFEARYAGSASEACAIMLEMIPLSAVIGIGDSVSLRQTGVIESLAQRGNRVINPFTQELTQLAGSRVKFIETCRQAMLTDVFMTSANAVTRDGKLISVDFAGNRVAGTIFGPGKVILVVGRNKITRDIEEADRRLKEVVCPFHARGKGRRTPCATTGKCSDCESPERICGVTVIIERKLAHNDFAVILVDEDLGLSWDPAWDSRRIAAIQENYFKYSWSFTGMAQGK